MNKQQNELFDLKEKVIHLQADIKMKTIQHQGELYCTRNLAWIYHDIGILEMSFLEFYCSNH